MTITAKYAGTCPVCRQSITPGAKVEWTKGSQARHVACAQGVSAPARAPLSNARIATERKSWGARRGMGSGHGAAVRMPGYSSYCTDNASCRCYDCA
jgi:hypothetical protein